jgi:hypothetical protein
MENKFEYIEKKVKELGFRINSKDFNRPWGGFLVIDENQSDKFIKCFFENLNLLLQLMDFQGVSLEWLSN